MTIAPVAPSAFAVDRVSSPLDAAARALTSAYDDASGLFVIAVWPETDMRRVVSNGAAGTLRAAVSVAVAAGNDRVWSDAPDDTIAEYAVTSLPEVVRSAASASGHESVHIGVVRDHGSAICVAMWFAEALTTRSTQHEQRVEAMRTLTSAVAREIEFDAANVAASDVTPEQTDLDGYRPIEFDPDDPNVDPLTGLSNRVRFDEALDEYELDEATLLFIGLDGFTDFTATYGTDSGDALLRETAARLAAVCRKNDLIARIGIDEFAILLDNTDRSSGLNTSKRLLAVIAEPLPEHIAPTGITASVGLAHEFGLLDMIELFESAGDAVASSKRSGPGRVVIAA